MISNAIGVLVEGLANGGTTIRRAVLACLRQTLPLLQKRLPAAFLPLPSASPASGGDPASGGMPHLFWAPRCIARMSVPLVRANGHFSQHSLASRRTQALRQALRQLTSVRQTIIVYS